MGQGPAAQTDAGDDGAGAVGGSFVGVRCLLPATRSRALIKVSFRAAVCQCSMDNLMLVEVEVAWWLYGTEDPVSFNLLTSPLCALPNPRTHPHLPLRVNHNSMMTIRILEEVEQTAT